MRIRIGDDDRARLGIEVEWVDGDMSHLSMDEAEAFEKASGLDYHRMGGLSVTGVRAKAWLGLHRAGVSVEWDKLRFDLALVDMDFPGKARRESASTPTSTTSSTSTRRTRKPRSAT